MTNIFLKIMTATATNIPQKNQWGCVNTCKPTVYNTHNSMKTRTKRTFAPFFSLFLSLFAIATTAQAQAFGSPSRAIDECKKPTYVTISEIGTSNATLSWTENGEATEWQIMLNDDYGNLIQAPTNPFTLTNLTPGTEYTVKVTPWCEMEKWSDERTFTTQCEPITITADAPYTEGFESPQGTAYNAQGPLPSCWEANSTGNIAPHNTTGYYIEGSQSLSFNYEGASYSNGTNYAYLPEFTNPLNELKISFYMYMSGNNNSSNLQLGYITAENNFFTIETYDYNPFTIQRTVYLLNVPTTAQRLAFRWTARSGNTVCIIDNVEVAIDTDCHPVNTLRRGGMTASSAYLSWNLIDNSQEAWDVQVATDAAFTENVANHEADTHENYLLTGLEAATFYYVRVKPSCSTDLWSNIIVFKTPCEPITITHDSPYFEGFGSPVGIAIDDPMPDCWEKHEYSIGIGLYTYSYYYAVWPEFSNPVSDLAICFRKENTMGSFSLGYLTAEDDGTCNTFTEIANYPSIGDMIQYTEYLSLLDVPVAAKRLAFRWSKIGDGGTCYIGDVNVSLAPDCYPVGVVSIVGRSTTYAYLSWTLIDNTQTEWDVQVATDEAFTENMRNYTTDTRENFLIDSLIPGTFYYVRVKPSCSEDQWTNNGFNTYCECCPVSALRLGEVFYNSAYLSWDLFPTNQAAAWDVQVATDEDFTNILADEETDSNENYFMEGLSGNTQYYVRVKPSCSEDLWSAIDFETPCGTFTVTADAPYTQGFESPEGTLWTGQGPLPPCWEGYNSEGYPAPHNTIGSEGAPHIIHSGEQCLSFHNNSDCYAILPEFSNPISDLQINFWMATEGNSTGQLCLGYITAEDDGTCNTFAEIASYGDSNGSMAQRSTTLENVPAEAQRLVFKWWSGGIKLCFIDDVVVSLNPSMIPPRDIAAVNIMPNSADITWEGSCGSYALRYREIPTLLKEGFEGGTMPEGWTIEGDNQDPAKTWRVGVGDHHEATGTHSGDYNALIRHNTMNQVTYLVTPALDLGEYADAELSFWYVNRNYQNDIDEFAVCYRIGNEGEWNELWSTAVNHNTWTSQTVVLAGLADNYQIGFRFTDHYGYGVGLDDIAICEMPLSEWITFSEAESPHTLTGLATETDYEVQVKSNCAGYEDWSETVVFTTLEACPVPFNVEASGIAATSAAVSWTGFSDSYNLSYRRAPSTPLNEGFEGGTMPEGWTIEGGNQNTYTTWRVGVGDHHTATGTHSGNYNALITHNTNNQVTYLVTPALDLGEYGSVELSFWYVNRKWVGVTDEFAVCYRIGNGGEWNELWSTAESHGVWTSQTVALTGLADNYQIGFRFTDLFGYGVGLDDVVLFDMTHSEWIILSEAESPHTLTGLLPETEYEVKVQGVCDGEATEWSESTYFTTLEGTTFTKDILAHTDNGGWYLIASPVAEAVMPTAQNGFLANEYDLYRFNQSAELEWENWKAQGEHYHFNLEAGRGYLYANSGDVTLTFVGTPHAATEPAEVPLAYDPAADFAGWNLVGNPLPGIAFIDRDFYVMNGDRNEIVAAEGNTVELMEGIFVIAEGENDTMTFTPASQSAIANNASLVVSLSQGRGSVIDRAIVRFDSNRTLPKFQLNPNNTKVYIPQGGKDYAVVAAEQTGEMPLNFKAEKNGTYTLRFDTKDVAFDYLHLIDNLTGADVDLLVVEPVETPTGDSAPEPVDHSVVEPVETTTGTGPSTGSGTSYTFTARTTDYESRFKLVFACGDGPSTGSGTFAYISNGTLQVVDVMGRIIRTVGLSQRGSHTTTTGMPAGMYVLRLIDGDSVRTQKIVID